MHSTDDVKCLGAAVIAAFVILLGSAQAAAWAASAPRSLAELIQAAKGEGGVLNVTWAGAMGGAEAVKPLEEAFNRKYGLKVRVNHTPGPTMPQLAARLIQEAKAGRKASFDFFVSSEAHPGRLIDADVAEAVPWSQLFPHMTPEMQEFGGRTVKVSTGFRGVFYNTKLVKPVEVPQKTEDVFKPHWKGKIASTIYAAQFDRLAMIKGADETRALLRKTAEWAGGLIRCPDEDRVLSGEFILLFLSCNDARTRVLHAQGAPINYAMMEDGLMMGFNYITIPKNSEHPNLAKLFTGFVVGQEGQAVLDRFGYGLHLVEGTQKYKQYQTYAKKGLKFNANTATQEREMGTEIEKLREEFQNILQKK
jgi:iron(III) transport system substrate-binding protein